MSTVIPTQEQAAQAQSFMIDQIHVPAFLEKLAANGIQPRNNGEVKQLLQLGAVLAQAEANGQIKSAEERGNPFLSHCLTRLAPKAPKVDMDTAIKMSADQLVANSQLAKTAALIYGHVAAGGEVNE